MHERELKVLWRGGALLAIASLARVVAGIPTSGTNLGAASVLDSLLVASRAEQERDAHRAQPLGVGERIDPNSAGADELARLPRIGPALAARVVQERAEGGAFKSLQDLGRVRGIGPRLLEGLDGLVTLPNVPIDTANPTNARPRPLAGHDHKGGVRQALDINRATADQLVQLPGVGPVLAERIVAFRERNGGFRSADELLQVRGIGAAKLRDIKAVLALQR